MPICCCFHNAVEKTICCIFLKGTDKIVWKPCVRKDVCILCSTIFVCFDSLVLVQHVSFWFRRNFFAGCVANANPDAVVYHLSLAPRAPGIKVRTSLHWEIDDSYHNNLFQSVLWGEHMCRAISYETRSTCRRTTDHTSSYQLTEGAKQTATFSGGPNISWWTEVTPKQKGFYIQYAPPRQATRKLWRRVEGGKVPSSNKAIIAEQIKPERYFSDSPWSLLMDPDAEDQKHISDLIYESSCHTGWGQAAICSR